MKINDEILKETATILRNQELNDPRLKVMISVTRVDTTKDLSLTKIFVSIYSDQKDEVMEGLTKSSGYIRRLLAQRINLRKTPRPIFVLDDSIENSIIISKLLDEAKRSSGKE